MVVRYCVQNCCTDTMNYANDYEVVRLWLQFPLHEASVRLSSCFVLMVSRLHQVFLSCGSW